MRIVWFLMNRICYVRRPFLYRCFLGFPQISIYEWLTSEPVFIFLISSTSMTEESATWNLWGNEGISTAMSHWHTLCVYHVYYEFLKDKIHAVKRRFIGCIFFCLANQFQLKLFSVSKSDKLLPEWRWSLFVNSMRV